MALNVTGNIVLDNGISINSMYCRTDAELTVNGNEVYAVPYFWVSKEAYQNGAMQIKPNFINSINVVTPYDRATETSDILQYSNEYMKFVMESKGLTASIIDL